MFGYVRPPLAALPAEEADRFRRMYCGLCHTLGRRYGTAARDGLQDQYAIARLGTGVLWVSYHGPADLRQETAYFAELLR